MKEQLICDGCHISYQDDVPATSRIFTLMESGFDPREMLSNLPSAPASMTTMSSQSMFYCLGDIAHLSPVRARVEQYADRSHALRREMVLFVQRWVNADPEFHTRLALFNVLYAVGETGLAASF